MESSNYQKKKMSFNLDWFEDNESIICCVELCGYRLLFSDYFYAFFQYLCYIIIYLLMMKLIKDIINRDSDEYF